MRCLTAAAAEVFADAGPSPAVLHPDVTATRPLVRWHGGKWRIAPWIVSLLPPHEAYSEVFGGGASVMLRKPRAGAEIYNDLDSTIVELMRVARDPQMAAELVRLIELTPFARVEFEAAYEPSEDPVESARRTLVRSFMGFGSDGTAGRYPTGFRCNMTSRKKMPAQEWATYPDALRLTIQRLRGVAIESVDARLLLPRIDRKFFLHFVDPPYLPSTRSSGNRRRGKGFHVYEHELEEEEHGPLLDLLLSLTGMVVLSGYPSPLYDKMLRGWQKHQRAARADGGAPRTEVVWLNPAAVAAREGRLI